MKAYTTIEESKQLVKAGLDVKTADMIYSSIGYYNVPFVWISKPYTHPKDILCWSLVALIDLIPNGIHWYLDENGLTIAEVDHYKDGKEVCVFREFYRNPVDAIIWLLENNYMKSNKNETNMQQC